MKNKYANGFRRMAKCMCSSVLVIIPLSAAMAFSPTDLEGLELWLDASNLSSISTTSVGRVMQWADVSGKTNNAVQATDNMRPVFVANVTNQMPGIRFTGGGGLQTPCVPATGGNPRTLIALVANVAPSGENYSHIMHYGTMNSLQAYGICQRLSGVDSWGNHYWGVSVNTGVGSVGSGALVIDSYSNAVDRMYINGNSPFAQNIPLATGNAYGIGIGMRISGSEYGVFDALEILAFSRVLDEMDRQMLEGYLTGKWGMSGLLQDDHPFKYGVSGAKFETMRAENITAISADIPGSLISTGAYRTAIIAYWGSENGKTNAADWAHSTTLPAPQPEGPFSVGIDGLTPNTLYYYRFAASNEVGVSFAQMTGSFSTRHGPSVVSDRVATFGATQVDVAGTVSDDSGLPTYVTAYWGIADGGTDPAAWAHSASFGIKAQGSGFTGMLSGLTPNTDYFWTLSASNAAGVAWAPASRTFRSWGPPSLGSVSFASVADTAAGFLAAFTDGGQAYLAVETWTAAGVTNTHSIGAVAPGEYSIVATGLMPLTEYGWRVVASNAWGVAISMPGSIYTIETPSQRESAKSGPWSEMSTWYPVGVPEVGNTVLIKPTHVVKVDTSTKRVASVDVEAGATLTFDGWAASLNADAVTVSGTMTHEPTTATNDVAGVWTPNARVNVFCDALTVASGGKIDVSGKGFIGGNYVAQRLGKGPGGGGTSDHRAGGGGYGGRGNGEASNLPGKTYGSAPAPDMPGSGGGSTWQTGSNGGPGGGLVVISATGQVKVDGIINADGVAGYGHCPGGGSGGGVNIQCATFTGVGKVTADGGAGFTGGGGGRIAINYTTESQAALNPVPAVSFSLKPQPGGVMGDPGTLYFSSHTFYPGTSLTSYYRLVIPGFTQWLPQRLTVTNGMQVMPEGLAINVAGDIEVGAAGVFLVSNIVVSCGGDMRLIDGGIMQVHGAVTNGVAPYETSITAGGEFAISPGSVVNLYSNPTNGGSAFFDVGAFSLADGAKINAAGRGFKGQAMRGLNGCGPGGGIGILSHERGGGGGYGGRGATHRYSEQSKGGPAYGSAVAPAMPGSGGGGPGGGSGGGLLWMRVRGPAVVDGAIEADGTMVSWIGGDGSGGGIYLDCDKFSGSGTMTANGGYYVVIWNGAWEYGQGNGGGGRIAVWNGVGDADRERILAGDLKGVSLATSFETFTGTATATNWSNGYPGELAQPGTVVFLTVPPPPATMIIIK